MQENSLESIQQQLEPSVPMSFPLGRGWYVAMTYAKQELDAVDAVISTGLDAYVPRSRHRKIIRQRRCEIERPLFPGYIFVGADPDFDEGWESKINNSDGIMDLLAMPSGDSLIPTRVPKILVDRIKRAEAAGYFDFTRPASSFKVGDEAEIMEGPFCGLIAKVRSAKDKKRIKLLLGALPIDVDACNLVKVV